MLFCNTDVCPAKKSSLKNIEMEVFNTISLSSGTPAAFRLRAHAGPVSLGPRLPCLLSDSEREAEFCQPRIKSPIRVTGSVV